MNAEPGTAEDFEYCNLATGIAASIIEKVSAKRFDVFMKEKLFDKLGIKASYNVQDFSEADINNIATLYRVDSEENEVTVGFDNYKGIKPAARDLSAYTIGLNGLVFAPQGGVRISAKDLSKIMMMLENRGTYNNVKILEPATVDLMTTKFWEGDGLWGFYKKKGLYVHITDDLIPGEEMFGHGGDAYGLLSDMYFSKENDFGLIFIMNGGDLTWGEIIFYLIEEQVAAHTYSLLFQ